MQPVRGIITNPLLPDGIPRPVPHHLLDTEAEVQRLTVELVRGTADQDGPSGRPDHPTALGLACLRDIVDGRVYLVEDLPPYSELRLTEPPADDEGRQLLDDIIKEGLPVANSPLTGKA